MANTEAKDKIVADKKQKSVKIAHHHAKPYRKRHYLSFLVLLFVGLSFVAAAVVYNNRLQSGLQSVKDFFAGNSSVADKQLSTVNSTYGFSFTYDRKQLFATALDTATGDLFVGNELEVNRPYELVRIAPTLADAGPDAGNFTLRYYNKTIVADPKNTEAVEAAVIKDITGTANLQVKKLGTSNVEYGGKVFTKTTWVFQSDNKIFSGLTPSFSTYTTVYGDKIFMAQVVHAGLTDGEADNKQYEPLLQSLHFGDPQTGDVKQSVLSQQHAVESRSLLESAIFGQLAYAADSPASTASFTSEKISTTYSPAVVKIFNVYCQDILVDGEQALKNSCSGGTGSGFFINQDGYIASNGHVTSSNPKDILINAAYYYYRRGDSRLIDYLGVKAKLTPADLPTGTPTVRLEFLFDKLYGIDDSRVTAQNDAVNLLVSLGKEQPDVKELLAITNKRELYAEQPTIKKAKPVAQDFRSIDGITKFFASDVAIIKIDGSNYPVTKLGSINSLLQGVNLSILGFPGNATNNGIVDSSEAKATLTSGKVSSIKNALGSDRKLIETDTTIGHGNSGGPAFNETGEVVGIATYTAAKVGDGTYNYVRDVKDVIDLASKNGVTPSTTSQTQTEWEKALAQFNTAHYSKAVKGFEKVKDLYSAHPRVDELIAVANENIKAGKDVKDFPILLVAIGGVVLLLGAGVAVFVIHRHKKTHNVYKAQVGAGMMQPLQQGSAPQTVNYDPAYVAAQKNVVDMHAYIQQPAVPQQPAAAAPVFNQAPQAVPNVVQPQLTQPANGSMPTQTIMPSQNQQPPTPPTAV